MRLRIILALTEKPANTNQLAKDLGVDYKTIEYQLGVLLKNGLLQTPNKEDYGALYFLSPLMEGSLDFVKTIWGKYGKSNLSKKGGGA